MKAAALVLIHAQAVSHSSQTTTPQLTGGLHSKLETEDSVVKSSDHSSTVEVELGLFFFFMMNRGVAVALLHVVI